MLTEACTTIVDGQWYIRRDFDSKYYRIGKMDYEREDATGVPAYVGFQLEIDQPKSHDDIKNQAAKLMEHKWATIMFIRKFMMLAIRYLPRQGGKNV